MSPSIILDISPEDLKNFGGTRQTGIVIEEILPYEDNPLAAPLPNTHLHGIHEEFHVEVTEDYNFTKNFTEWYVSSTTDVSILFAEVTDFYQEPAKKTTKKWNFGWVPFLRHIPWLRTKNWAYPTRLMGVLANNAYAFSLGETFMHVGKGYHTKEKEFANLEEVLDYLVNNKVVVWGCVEWAKESKYPEKETISLWSAVV